MYNKYVFIQMKFRKEYDSIGKINVPLTNAEASAEKSKKFARHR